MKEVRTRENPVLLHCTDKRFRIRYITAELNKQNLIIRYTNHFINKSNIVDYIYKFDTKSTKRFMELISPTDFLNNLKKNFNSFDALEKISQFADENNLTYKIYNHFDYDEYNIFRYNLDDIYDDNDRLYYEDGSIIIPVMYHHPQNGISKIYTGEGNIYYEITYKNNMKNGVMKGYFQDSNILQIEQYYKDDLLDGIATSYYSNGDLKRKELFENGKLIETLESNINNAEAWFD